MNKQVVELNTGYTPKVEPLQGLKLPIELKNHKGEVLASIFFLDYNKKYYWQVNGIDRGYHVEFDSFEECLVDCFGSLYQTMQNYQKESEAYDRLRSTLAESMRGYFR